MASVVTTTLLSASVYLRGVRYAQTAELDSLWPWSCVHHALACWVNLTEHSQKLLFLWEYEVLGMNEYVRCIDVTLEKYAYCHLRNGLRTCLMVSLYFVNSNIILAIASCCNCSHRDKFRCSNVHEQDVC